MGRYNKLPAFMILIPALMLTISLPAISQSTCNCSGIREPGASIMSALSLSAISIISDTVPQSTIDSAAAMWNETCGIDGNSNHPKFLTNQSQGTVINLISGVPRGETGCGPGCACTFLIVDADGLDPNGGIIYVFDESVNGTDFRTKSSPTSLDIIWD